MTTYLTIQNLSIALDTHLLLNNASFAVSKNDKIGIIGHNGCGKSTLLHVLNHQLEASSGTIHQSKHCVIASVAQHFPDNSLELNALTLLQNQLPPEDYWQAECLCQELELSAHAQSLKIRELSGGQQMRLLLGLALIKQPDLLLLDEPSNHLDLPSLLWLERFLARWKGAFVLVSHDATLLDNVTSSSWILRDQSLHCFDLPCTQARQALAEQDLADQQRFRSEQKEIDRLDASAKRLANWGKVYDNEDLARKAKTMQARKEKLQTQQTIVSQGSTWRLQLHGQALQANRILEISELSLYLPESRTPLLYLKHKLIKSGENIAIIGHNGCGKSTLLQALFTHYTEQNPSAAIMRDESRNSATIIGDIKWHGLCQLGYYDQDLEQISTKSTIKDALIPFANLNDDQRKQALISAGFAFERHQQHVASLSGGERARLLFLGLSLAQHHLVLLDEPTNHLDLEGKEQLIDTLNTNIGAALVVSHDRDLLQKTCGRFWLIDHGQIIEFDEFEKALPYLHHDHKVQENHVHPPSSQTCIQSQRSNIANDYYTQSQQSHDDLERLIELEEKLTQDRQRKPKHQKPKLQQQWQTEIDLLNLKLSL